MQTIPRKNLYLVAIALPGNLAREAQRLRMGIFRRSGLPSSRALPECLPLSWHETRVSPGTGSSEGGVATLEGVSVAGRDLFLRFAIPPLRFAAASAIQGASRASEGLPDAGNGAFLARFPSESAARAALPGVVEDVALVWPHGLRFKPTELIVLELAVESDVERSARWREAGSFPIHSGRKTGGSTSPLE